MRLDFSIFFLCRYFNENKKKLISNITQTLMSEFFCQYQTCKPMFAAWKFSSTRRRFIWLQNKLITKLLLWKKDGFELGIPSSKYKTIIQCNNCFATSKICFQEAVRKNNNWHISGKIYQDDTFFFFLKSVTKKLFETWALQP